MEINDPKTFFLLIAHQLFSFAGLGFGGQNNDTSRPLRTLNRQQSGDHGDDLWDTPSAVVSLGSFGTGGIFMGGSSPGGNLGSLGTSPSNNFLNRSNLDGKFSNAGDRDRTKSSEGISGSGGLNSGRGDKELHESQEEKLRRIEQIRMGKKEGEETISPKEIPLKVCSPLSLNVIRKTPSPLLTFVLFAFCFSLI